jgi:hypothetical protein
MNSMVRQLCRPVCKLDQDDTRVIVEREEDTLEILCLETLGGKVLVLIVQDGLDLREAVHETGDLIAENGPAGRPPYSPCPPPHRAEGRRKMDL